MWPYRRPTGPPPASQHLERPKLLHAVGPGPELFQPGFRSRRLAGCQYVPELLLEPLIECRRRGLEVAPHSRQQDRDLLHLRSGQLRGVRLTRQPFNSNDHVTQVQDGA